MRAARLVRQQYVMEGVAQAHHFACRAPGQRPNGRAKNASRPGQSASCPPQPRRARPSRRRLFAASNTNDPPSPIIAKIEGSGTIVT